MEKSGTARDSDREESASRDSQVTGGGKARRSKRPSVELHRRGRERDQGLVHPPDCSSIGPRGMIQIPIRMFSKRAERATSPNATTA
jgi:hypothetical protein